MTATGDIGIVIGTRCHVCMAALGSFSVLDDPLSGAGKRGRCSAARGAHYSIPRRFAVVAALRTGQDVHAPAFVAMRLTLWRLRIRSYEFCAAPLRRVWRGCAREAILSKQEAHMKKTIAGVLRPPPVTLHRGRTACQ